MCSYSQDRAGQGRAQTELYGTVRKLLFIVYPFVAPLSLVNEVNRACVIV